MESTASQYFGAMVEQYDSLIRRCVPRYDEMLERLVGYLPDGARRILELGTGTGNLTLALLRRYPAARIATVDAAAEMLDATRSRAGSDAGRLDFLLARFEEVAVERGSVDLVVSSISLHHVADKAALYRRLQAALRPGGHLVFADQLRGGDERLHAINWERWLDFCRQPGHCTPEEVQSLLDHAAAHDHYTPLAEHFRLLQEAGFEDLDCAWRNWIWGIVVARKPAGGA